jgi:hypothetical protein
MNTNFVGSLGPFIAGSPKRGNTFACARKITPLFAKGGGHRYDLSMGTPSINRAPPLPAAVAEQAGEPNEQQ